MNTTIERARAYLSKLPPAIAGSGGHHATYEAAAVLTRGFALPEDAALELLSEWNETHCQPPWRESELRGKLSSAATSSTRPFGYLLNDEQAVTVPRRATVAHIPSGDAIKAKQRAAWPEMMALTPNAIVTIAKLRVLPKQPVELAHHAGFLRGILYEGHQCFVIREANFAQVRRLDGGKLETAGGPQKSKNLLGSQGAFIGKKWLNNRSPVLLVEGAIGLLEAAAAIHLTDRTDWTCLAATSASSRFARDPALLEQLRGRTVRIVPDNDETGLDAASVWQAELEAGGVTVEAVGLPDGCKDLGDFIAHHDQHTESLSSLFS